MWLDCTITNIKLKCSTCIQSKNNGYVWNGQWKSDLKITTTGCSLISQLIKQPSEFQLPSQKNNKIKSTDAVQLVMIITTYLQALCIVVVHHFYKILVTDSIPSILVLWLTTVQEKLFYGTVRHTYSA